MGHDKDRTSELDDDAQFAVNQFSSWIMSADTKAGLLVMALTILLATALGQRDRIVMLMTPGDLKAWFGLSCSVVAAIAMVTALVHLLERDDHDLQQIFVAVCRPCQP